MHLVFQKRTVYTFLPSMLFNNNLPGDLLKTIFASYSLAAIILIISSCAKASLFNSQPQFSVKAVANKAFDDLCLIGTFNTGDIADCLEHCLQECRCQSFQICHNTKCQLCSSHKEENGSLLHGNHSCVYAMYEIQYLTEKFQVT